MRIQPACNLCATRQACLFGAATQDDLAQIAPQIRPVSLPSGRLAMQPGDRRAAIRIIREGQALMSHKSSYGSVLPLSVEGRGMCLGSLKLLGLPVAFSYNAIGTLHLCELDVDAIHALPGWSALLRPRSIEMAFEHVRRVSDWSAAVRHLGAHRKLAACLLLLQRNAGTDLVRAPPDRLLASMLGLSRETVSKALTKLHNDGHAVRVSSRTLRLDPCGIGALLDVPALEARTQG